MTLPWKCSRNSHTSVQRLPKQCPYNLRSINAKSQSAQPLENCAKVNIAFTFLAFGELCRNMMHNVDIIMDVFLGCNTYIAWRTDSSNNLSYITDLPQARDALLPFKKCMKCGVPHHCHHLSLVWIHTCFVQFTKTELYPWSLFICAWFGLAIALLMVFLKNALMCI